MTFWTCSACNMGLVFLGEAANRWPLVEAGGQVLHRRVLAEYACQNPACPRRDKVVTVEEAG